MNSRKCRIGMIGLGVMGRNLVLNIADNGFSVAGYDKDPEKVLALESEAGKRPVYSSLKIEDFMSSLDIPKIVMLLVPAGKAVDAAIAEVIPHLSANDIIIDGGNSHFNDTDLRAKKLAERRILYLGVGVSGGESGARHGPSIMPGGPQEAYKFVQPIFEAIAAKVGSTSCVAYIGPGSAGHYVKMVHNGIEYAMLQLIAETYDLMKRGLDFSDDQLSETYEKWNNGKLNGFLVQITAEIFKKVDEKTGKRLIDVVLDEARQKGTGIWTSENAMQLNIPVPNIDIGVEMRYLSCFKSLRLIESRLLGGPEMKFHGDATGFIDRLENALYTAMVVSYSQGFALFSVASQSYGYDLDLEKIASIWRGGCIIRSAVLEDIADAYHNEPRLPHLLEDKKLAKELSIKQDDLRFIVKSAAELGIPAPGMMAAISYFDGLRSPWLPANLIQAQRDYFGSHTYERIDEKGTFHTKWSMET